MSHLNHLSHLNHRGDRKRRFSLLLGTALSVSLLATGCRSNSEEAGAAVPQGVPVKVQRLESETIRESTTFVGTLEAVETVDVRTEAQGRVETIFVEAGQFVNAGQSLLLLKPDQTVPQLQGDLAGVDVARSNLEASKTQLELAKVQQRNAQSKFDVAADYEPRLKQLFEKGAIEQLRYDQGLLEVETARDNFAMAMQEVVAAEIAITKAEDALRQSEAMADASQLSLQAKEVVSPIAGIVGELSLKRGDFVGTGDVVGKVTQTENLLLNVEVPSNKSSQLKEGLSVQLIDPGTKDQITTGTISFVSPTVNTEGQTILAKALFNNVGRKLRDGQTVEARLVWNTSPGVLIPTTAITRVGSKNFVYVVNKGANAESPDVVNLKPVELGAIQGDSYEVVSGLTAGDRVAVSNILKLGDGAPIVPDTGPSATGADANREADANDSEADS